jgi:Type II secretion system (T2SS), protein G
MSEETKKLGASAFIVGGLSFVPAIGVLFGIAAIIWGLVSKRAGAKTVARMGIGGIVFSCLIYGGLFYFGFVQRGGFYDALRAQLARTTLNSCVPAIEFYKVQHGNYPESLEELRASLPKESFALVYDPMIVTLNEPRSYFFYQRVGTDHYYLRSVGPDGVPFTTDDIVPQIDNANGKLGLLLEPPKR